MLRSLVLLMLFGFSCAEKTVVVGEEPVHRPPGLAVASEKALENGKKTACQRTLRAGYSRI